MELTTKETIDLWALGEGINPDSFNTNPKYLRYLEEKDGLGVLEVMQYNATTFLTDTTPNLYNPMVKLELISIVNGNPIFFNR